MAIGIIVARQESTRLRNKNMRLFNGVSLFQYSLEKLLKVKLLHKIYVCSDDSRIKEICSTYESVEFIDEPKELAKQDKAWEAIKYVLNSFDEIQKDEIVAYVPVTCPLRSIEDVDNAIRIWTSYQYDCESVISVCKCTEPPEWAFEINNKFLDFKNFPMTSQELKDFYYLNGAIYVSTKELVLLNDGFFFTRTLPYLMPRERSIDIDDELDFIMAESITYNEAVKKVEEKLGGGTERWTS